ncbi:MAG: ABC transporter ATP-binding protein [Chloroflexota bacterium]
MTGFISATNLTKFYQEGEIKTTALAGLNLQIEQGEIVAIIGPSGSGKSTFLNILGGLDRPTSGSLTVGQVDITTLDDETLSRYRRDAVGFVWQQTSRNLLPYLTVRQNLLLPMKLRGIPRKKREAQATSLLEAVEIDHRLHYRAKILSGGEQQRAAIAIALAHKPGILLADEPTGSVDSETTATIVRLFRKLAHQFGVTVIIVSHDTDLVAQVDRVLAIEAGRIYNFFVPV